jgi:hypothetical protein
MKKILFLSILVLSVAACSSGDSEHPKLAPISTQFDTVTLQRTACYGQCPIYAVEIRNNGQVKYVGEEFVKVVGVRQANVPTANIELLAAAVRHVRFEQMQGKYQSEKDGCVSLATDHPSISISVTTAGIEKAVVFYVGCHGPNVPAAELEWLANTIDVMAHTSPLVNQLPN